MSTSCVSFRSEYESDYAVDSRGSFEKISKQNRRPQYRRSSTPPGSVNGIHRRRNSRWNWGHGRAAHSANLRAFARCAVAAITAMWATAASAGVLSVNVRFGSATEMDFVPIGNPGNVGRAISSGTFGAVAQLYNIGKSEVTNNEYVTFLNAVAASDPLGLYNSAMNSSATGGISRSGGSGSFTYSVKSPTAGNQPVNWVSVYDAARFTNWLHNGAPTSVAPGSVNSILNSGAYTLANVENPGTALVRNSGAVAFLPTRNEWYKAAYYSQSLNGGSGGYYTYASGTNAAPSVSTNPLDTATNVGYYGQSNLSIPMIADGLPNTDSAYGAVGMLGNVSEWLQDSTATQAFWIGGWFNMPTGNLNSQNSNSFAGALQSTMNQTGAQGFRVAAVPEPSTIMLAVLGLATVGGGEIARRRKVRAASSLAA